MAEESESPKGGALKKSMTATNRAFRAGELITGLQVRADLPSLVLLGTDAPSPSSSSLTPPKG